MIEPFLFAKRRTHFEFYHKSEEMSIKSAEAVIKSLKYVNHKEMRMESFDYVIMDILKWKFLFVFNELFVNNLTLLDKLA